MLYHYQLFYRSMANSQALVLFKMYSTCMQIGHKFGLILECFYFHILIIGMMNENMFRGFPTRPKHKRLGPIVQNFVCLTLSLSPQFVNYIDFKSKYTVIFVIAKDSHIFQQKITVYGVDPRFLKRGFKCRKEGFVCFILHKVY